MSAWRRVRRSGLVLLALVLLAAIGGAAWLGLPASGWSLRAVFAGADDDRAWAYVPAGRPVAAVCDVHALLDSPIGRAERPRLQELASRHGFDMALAERGVRRLVVSADGADFAYGVASGFRVSPLVLARATKRWKIVPFDAGGLAVDAASDGSTILAPLEPGLVAWVPWGAAPQRVSASLAAAAASPRPALPLEGAALRVTAEVDEALRRDVARRIPVQARALADAIVRLDARIVAGQDLELRLTLGHRDEATATATANLLRQLDMAAQLARGAGSLATLLGRDAQILAQLPPLEVTQSGVDVTVVSHADAPRIDSWLAAVK